MHSTKLSIIVATILLVITVFASLGPVFPVWAETATAANSYRYKVLSGEHVVLGEQRALVILVEFQDVRHSVTAGTVKTVALNQLNSYYGEVSYGKVSISGEVYGWYRVEHAIGYYGRDDSRPGADIRLYSLAEDALALLPSSVDLDSFKFLVIVHAGMDQAFDENKVLSNQIWSQSRCGTFPDYGLTRPVILGSKSFRCYTFLSEFDGVGTFAHEWGHLLGLPDLYDAETGDSYVGYWSLMDTGSFCCSMSGDETPSYIGAWGASILGWVTPSIAEIGTIVTSFTLNPLESPSASPILIPLSSSGYYFVEYRKKSGEDSNLPSSGILLYYVNESRESGMGIVKLVDPENGHLFAAQDHPEALDGAAFTTEGTFRDAINNVYLAFKTDEGVVTAIYSTRELAESLLKSNLRPTQVSFSGLYTERMQLNAILTDDEGTPIGSQSVQLQLFNSVSQHWEPIANEPTSQDGVASFSFDLDYPVGDYKARFVYRGGKAGSVWYATSSAEFDILIKSAILTVTISAPRTATTDNLPVGIFVASATGHPLAGVSITISVDNIQREIAQTDSNGKAMLVLTLGVDDVGWHTLTANAESANYSPAQATTTVLTVPPVWLVVLIIVVVVLVMVMLFRRRKTPVSVSSGVQS